MTGLPAVPIPEDLSIPDQHYAAAPACVCGFSRQGRNRAALEEFDFKEIEAKTDTTLLAGWIVSFLLSDKSEYRFSAAQFGSHFLVISDDEFTHFVRHSTEVSARIALNYDTKTVKTGALFYQEFLPAESLLYSLVLCNTAPALRADATVTGEFLSDWSRTVNEAGLLQIGGDESTGKGLCAVRLTPAEKMEP